MPPGRQWILFSVTRGSGSNRWDVAEIVAQSLESGERNVLWRGGSDARYVPTGHLVYALDDALFAIRLDLDRMQGLGGPVALVAGIQRAASPVINSGAAQYGLSEGGSTLETRKLVWVWMIGPDPGRPNPK